MTYSLPKTKQYFMSTRVIEQAEIDLNSFCREKFAHLTKEEQKSVNRECDIIRGKLKTRYYQENITREEIRCALIVALYYSAFGETPLMTAVNARGEG